MGCDIISYFPVINYLKILYFLTINIVDYIITDSVNRMYSRNTTINNILLRIKNDFIYYFRCRRMNNNESRCYRQYTRVLIANRVLKSASLPQSITPIT